MILVGPAGAGDDRYPNRWVGRLDVLARGPRAGGPGARIRGSETVGRIVDGPDACSDTFEEWSPLDLAPPDVPTSVVVLG